MIRYYAIKDIIKSVKPRNIITTFEGHILERLIFHASYRVSNKINRIAYQNTFLLKNQNSIFIKFKKIFMPDEIWLSGDIYLNKFKKNLKKIKLSIFGSPRKFKITKKNIPINFKKNICLVIPEGFYSSTFDLMKFCIDYSNKFSNIDNFIFRIHPELNINLLFKKFPELKNYKNHNIKISRNFDPRKDLVKSNLCLYRQTTLISQAVLFGLKPFYLVDKQNINVDSIYPLKKWKVYIKSTPDFMKKIKQFNSDKLKYKHLQYAKNMCNRFYTKINYKLISKI